MMVKPVHDKCEVPRKPILQKSLIHITLLNDLDIIKLYY